MSAKNYKHSPYYVIPRYIMSNKNLSEGAKLLYSLIANLSNQKGYCYATNRYLSQGLNKSTSQVKRYLKELTGSKLISYNLVYKNKQIVGRHIYLQHSSSMNIPKSKNDTTPLSIDEPYNTQSNNTQIKEIEKEKDEKEYTISKEFFEREIVKYPRVQELPKPLTHKSLSEIKDEYPEVDLNHYLVRMENYSDLHNKSMDAAKTLKIWIQRDINNNKLIKRRS